MKRVIRLSLFIFLFLSLIICFANLGKAKAYTYDLDRIQLYEIRVTPVKEDGSLNIDFHIVWEVLDSTTEGPLTWIKVGIPNYHATNITKISSNIKKIKYDSEDGSYIRIDFDRSYFAGEVLDIKFSYNQSYMYHLFDDIVVYDYHPGYWPDSKVDMCNLYWAKEGVEEVQPTSIPLEEENGYYKLSSELNYGGAIKINLRYSKSYFGELDPKKQYTDKYIKPITILIIVGVIAGVIGGIIALSAYAKSKQDPYMNERGFVTGYYHHYWFYHHRPHSYYGKTVNAKGARIVNPSSGGSSGGFHGGGGGCACACACACAGGGRAGCSKKDFYHTNLSSKEVLDKLD